jgi:chromosome partitioning protein
MDRQGSASAWLGLERSAQLALALSGELEWSEVASPTSLEGLDVMAASLELDDLAGELGAPSVRGQTLALLANGLELISSIYQLIIIDCPPAGSWLTLASLVAATHVLAPVIPAPEHVDGLGDLIDTVRQVQGVNPALELLGVLACQVGRTLDDRHNLGELEEHVGELLLKTQIRKNVKVREAYRAQQPVNLFDSSCNAAIDYQAATSEILERLHV